ncbi:MAG: hypothetical protein AB8G05_15810 [Oligoflexales bacterium]
MTKQEAIDLDELMDLKISEEAFSDFLYILLNQGGMDGNIASHYQQSNKHIYGLESEEDRMNATFQKPKNRMKTKVGGDIGVYTPQATSS